MPYLHLKIYFIQANTKTIHVYISTGKLKQNCKIQL